MTKDKIKTYCCSKTRATRKHAHFGKRVGYNVVCNILNHKRAEGDVYNPIKQHFMKNFISLFSPLKRARKSQRRRETDKQRERGRLI